MTKKGPAEPFDCTLDPKAIPLPPFAHNQSPERRHPSCRLSAPFNSYRLARFKPPLTVKPVNFQSLLKLLAGFSGIAGGTQ